MIDEVCWARLDAVVPHPKPGGTAKGYTRRQFVEAYAYLLRQGCRWRELPTTFPPWHTVYERVRQWRRAGVLEQIWAILYNGETILGDVQTSADTVELQL